MELHGHTIMITIERESITYHNSVV